MDYSNQMLPVKFKMPQPRKNYVFRKHLFSKLDSIVENKVTIVKAGAGSGKTTLLASYIKENHQLETRWITLDDSVNQVFVFWKYVMEALKDYIIGQTDQLQEFYDGNIQKDNLNGILAFFVSKVMKEKDIILVLDDFHLIQDPFLISTIDYFIENLSDNIHLVLLTRNMPQIYLGTLAMEGTILVLEEDSLRFSREESKTFLQNTMNMVEQGSNLENIIDASDGWIGGLQLLAVSLQGKNDQINAGIKLSAKMTDDYITREIFCYLSSIEQDFLIKTGILRYFSEEICEQFIPEINFKSMIDSILSKNLFVISLDDSSNVYRYHAILSEFLNKIVEQYDENVIQELHQKAADAYYKKKDYEECLHHLFCIKSYSKIMETLLQMPQTALTYAYMMKVPMEEIISNVDFALQYFFCYYVNLDNATCEKIYDYIKEKMVNHQVFQAFQHSNLFFADTWEFNRVNVLSLKQIHDMPINQVTRAFCLIKEAYFLYVTAKYQEALEYIEQAEEIYKKSGNVYIGFFVMMEKTQLYEDMGEMNLCLKIYKKMEEMLSIISAGFPSYYIGIAGVYIRQMELDKAWEALERAKEVIPEDSINMRHAYQYTLAEFSYASGNNDMTEHILTDILGQEISNNIYYVARLLRYPLNRGKHKELANWFVSNYEQSNMDVKYLDGDLLYASLQYDRSEAALTIINNVITIARKTQNKLKIIEGDLLKARFLYEKRSGKREICNLLIEAISYAYPEKIKIPFYYEEEFLKQIMSEFEENLKNNLTDEEWRFFKSACNSSWKANNTLKQKDNFELTSREKEVLIELSKGMTNKQIAETLCISLATVKSHIINLYGKLGASNRLEAVNKGKMYLN